MIKLYLNLADYIKDSSLLLLGPRQTGKSTLLKNTFKDAAYFDLLDPELYRDLNRSPSLPIEIFCKKLWAGEII